MAYRGPITLQAAFDSVTELEPLHLKGRNTNFTTNMEKCGKCGVMYNKAEGHTCGAPAVNRRFAGRDNRPPRVKQTELQP